MKQLPREAMATLDLPPPLPTLDPPAAQNIFLASYFFWTIEHYVAC